MQDLKLNETQKVLLEILAASLKNEKYPIDSSFDFEAVTDESRMQAVLLQVFNSLDLTAVDDELKKKCLTVSLKYLRNNLIIHSFHNYIHLLMSENDIDYCILKGCASARYYPDPIMRAMGDVDFLVDKDDIEKASEILVNEGFIRRDEGSACHIIFCKDNMRFEMHFSPAGMPEGAPGKLIKEYLVNVFNDIVLSKIGENEFNAPSDFYHGLFLLMHMYHHMLGEGIGLRHLCDWATFVNSIDNDKFEDIFKEKLTKCGLFRFAQILSFTACVYLKIEYKNWMGDIDKELAEDLIYDIFDSGNFGRKNNKRASQGIAISNRGKNGVPKNKLVQIISNLNYFAKDTMPNFSKIPLLKNFAFMPMSIRYIYRVLTGKRKMISFKNTFFESERRRKLYKNFNLFEIDKDF